MNDSSNSSTSDNITYLIPFCDVSGDICIEPRWFVYLVSAINITSMIANVFHVVILQRLTQRSQQTYMKLLKILTVTDILFAISVMTGLSCFLRRLAMNSYAVASFLLSMEGSVSLIQFGILTLASFDRWLAMARPFAYESSVMNRHPIVIVSSICVSLCSLVLARDLVSPETICMDPLHGISNCLSFLLGPVACSILMTTFFFLNLIFISLLLRELWKMKRRRATSESDVLLKKATRTVIATAILYFVCFAWPLFIAMLKAIVSEEFLHWFHRLQYAAFSLYGFGNIFLYGLINESYRTELLSLLPCKRRSSVQPQAKVN